MSRIRTIKPETFGSINLARVSIPARYLFHGLWCEADDEGRMKDHPGLIRSQIFPLDDGESSTQPAVTTAQVDGWLSDLMNAADTICRYEVDGTPYLHIPHFRDHQVINRPTPSRLPPCPDHPKDAAARTPNTEPHPRCPRHRNTNTPPPPCGACKEARMAHEKFTVANPGRRPATAICGSAGCTCDHTTCDVGWENLTVTVKGRETQVARKCPGCWPKTPTPTLSVVTGPEGYRDARSAAAGDK